MPLTTTHPYYSGLVDLNKIKTGLIGFWRLNGFLPTLTIYIYLVTNNYNIIDLLYIILDSAIITLKGHELFFTEMNVLCENKNSKIGRQGNKIKFLVIDFAFS